VIRVVPDCIAGPDGWTCQVRVGEGLDATRHEVLVREADLERLAPGETDPTDLVSRSFAFLLAREPKESILQSFDLTVIGRYFPEYEHEIRRNPAP
jgi:hypothetical protein